MNLKETWIKNGPELMAAVTGGLPAFVMRNTSRYSGIPIFCFHTVDHQHFFADLQFLKQNGYHTLSADEMLSVIRREIPLPDKAIVISFDDGVFNFYHTAFPLLQHFGHKAVLFIAPGLRREAAAETQDQRRPCTWEELLIMHESGHVDIQSHSWEHRSFQTWPQALPLTGVPPALTQERQRGGKSQAQDLVDAKHTLERRLNKIIRHLAWPRYYATPKAYQHGRQAGYEAFWTGTRAGHALNHPGGDPEQLTRISGEFIRRLPGKDRLSLCKILKKRYKDALTKSSKQG